MRYHHRRPAPTMTSADFCRITMAVSDPGAAQSSRMSGRSPRIRCVNFRYTTAAFTLSPEPAALSCCTQSACSGHPEQSRRVLTYPETGPCMLFLFVGSPLCTQASSGRNLAVPPPAQSPGSSTCRRLMFMSMSYDVDRIHTYPVERCPSQMAGCFQPAPTWIQAKTTEKDVYPKEEWQETAFINTHNVR